MLSEKKVIKEKKMRREGNFLAVNFLCSLHVNVSKLLI